jgi:hypothetical protein
MTKKKGNKINSLEMLFLNFPSELEKAKKCKSCIAITLLLSAFCNEAREIVNSEIKQQRKGKTK